MADYYTQFSCLFEVPATHRAFCQRLLTGEELFDDIDWSDPDHGKPQFGYKWEEVKKGEPEQLWIYSNGEGNVDDVCTFVAYCQKRLGLEEPFEIAWANTCSRPRLDSFGGGACVIFKGESSFIRTGSWMEREKKRMKDADDRKTAKLAGLRKEAAVKV